MSTFDVNQYAGNRGLPLVASTAFAVLLLQTAAQPDGAWPTVRGDTRRSGIASQSLQLPLYPQWTHTPTAPPRPAWPPPAVRNIAAQSNPLVPSQIYDRAYRVVGDRKRLYYGSSADDTVHCLKAADGTIQWRFSTEGPVRLAPTLHAGRVYAGSDDGALYCLDADTGRLVWKTRGAPEDRRLPGNGRMISRWPIRAGIIVDRETVYFAAGLFPCEGVHICALTAGDGSLVWRRKADISPQGYMLASPERLFVPSSRTPFHQVDRKSGETLGKYGKSKSWGRDLVGGSFALLLGDRLASGPSEDGHIHLFNAVNRERFIRVRGRQLIVNDTTAYAILTNGVQALDRPALLEGKEFSVRWHAELGPTFSMVLSGNTLFAGARDRVVALDGESGSIMWEGSMDGRAEDLAVCGEQLVVSSGNGPITCFAPASTAEPATASPPSVPPPPLPQAPPRTAPVGYAFLIGLENTDRLLELVSRTGHRVIGVDADLHRIKDARRHLQEAGAYGTRAVCHQADITRLPYQDRTANMVVLSPRLSGMESVREEAWRLVRPYGGTLEWWDAPNVNNASLRRRVRPAPDGAGEWTHFYADTGNTACSGDALPAGPMELQWFGRPGPHRMIDRHWKTVSPLCRNSRLFVSGNDYIAALDAYNGAVLWERDIPDSVRTAAFKHCGNMVATDDRLFVAAGDRCEVLDAQTGAAAEPLAIPEPCGAPPHEWGYLAHARGLLVGSVTRPGAAYRRQVKEMTPLIWGNEQPLVTSTALFAIDPASREARWHYRPRDGVVINPTLAVSKGRVLFVESGNTNSFADADGRLPLKDLLRPEASLVSLELGSGRLDWRTGITLTNMQHILYLSAADGKVLLTGTHYVGKGKKGRVRYDLKAYAADTGRLLWETTQKPDYDHVLDGGHGEQVQHPAIVGDVVYGPGFACRLSTGEPHDGWAWHKSHKCTTLSLSARCAFSRFTKAKNPYMFDLATGREWRLTTATRPGCWINMIPAGGLVLIPEASAGCTCEYPIQTSLALAPKAR